MREFKDRHKGQTCIVVGNGPSLKKIPLAFLKKYPTFGTNRCYLRFVPTYYAAVNPLVVGQFYDEIMQLDVEAMFLPDGIKHAGGGAYYLRSVYGPLMFSVDPAQGIHEGWTVTYVCLELAYYMGFETVLLVGVDHRYKYDGLPNQHKVAHGPDPNHFDPNYFGPGVHWNNPDLAMSEASYRLARGVYEAAGRRIVNCTPGTALRVFERERWRKWA